MRRSTKGLVLTILFVLLVLPGCSSRQRYADPYERESIERPAEPISQEEGPAEKVGKVLVVIVTVGIAIGLIVVPVLFL
ncbi:MAG TPA: hypothetical protein VEB21_13720, partial [Terriglobales bacterium]|nr:hypothetical protein [Terriglobales bacterium]